MHHRSFVVLRERQRLPGQLHGSVADARRGRRSWRPARRLARRSDGSGRRVRRQPRLELDGPLELAVGVGEGVDRLGGGRGGQAARYASTGRSAPAQWRASSAVAAAGDRSASSGRSSSAPGERLVEAPRSPIERSARRSRAAARGGTRGARPAGGQDAAGGGVAERRADLPCGPFQDRGEQPLVDGPARDGEGTNDREGVLVEPHDAGRAACRRATAGRPPRPARRRPRGAPRRTSDGRRIAPRSTGSSIAIGSSGSPRAGARCRRTSSRRRSIRVAPGARPSSAEPGEDGVARRQVVGPTGQDRDDVLGGDVADEERDQIVRRGIDPLDVLDDREHRLVGAEPAEDPEEALEQPGPVARRSDGSVEAAVRVRRGRAAPRRRISGTAAPGRRSPGRGARAPARGRRPDEVPKGLHERQIGQALAVEVQAGPVEDERAGWPGLARSHPRRAATCRSRLRPGSGRASARRGTPVPERSSIRASSSSRPTVIGLDRVPTPGWYDRRISPDDGRSGRVPPGTIGAWLLRRSGCSRRAVSGGAAHPGRRRAAAGGPRRRGSAHAFGTAARQPSAAHRRHAARPVGRGGEREEWSVSTRWRRVAPAWAMSRARAPRR